MNYTMPLLLVNHKHILSWSSLQQEENICVCAITITITMFHILPAHSLPRAGAGLLAAALYLLCSGVPAPATGQAGGLGLYGATPTPAARPPPRITNTSTLSPMQYNLI